MMVPWKHVTSMAVALGGLAAVVALADIGAVHDGETTSVVATVLATSVAIHHRKEDDNDGG